MIFKFTPICVSLIYHLFTVFTEFPINLGKTLIGSLLRHNLLCETRQLTNWLDCDDQAILYFLLNQMLQLSTSSDVMNFTWKNKEFLEIPTRFLRFPLRVWKIHSTLSKRINITKVTSLSTSYLASVKKTVMQNFEEKSHKRDLSFFTTTAIAVYVC